MGFSQIGKFFRNKVRPFIGRLVSSFANPAKVLIASKIPVVGSAIGGLASNLIGGIGNTIQGKKWMDGNSISGYKGTSKQATNPSFLQKLANSTIFNPAGSAPGAVLNSAFNGGVTPNDTNTFNPLKLIGGLPGRGTGNVGKIGFGDFMGGDPTGGFGSIIGGGTGGTGFNPLINLKY
jgi:hypothetical protein